MNTNIGFFKRLFFISHTEQHRVVYFLGMRFLFRSNSRISEMNSRISEMSNTLQQAKEELISAQQNIRQLQHEYATMQQQLRDTQKELRTAWSKINWLLDARLKMHDKIIKRIQSCERQANYRINKYMHPGKYEQALSDWFLARTGRPLDLANPKTYNEKIQWMKLYDSTPIKTRLADKYLVRDWVAERIGEQYLIPLLGVWDSFDEIDFETLPERFVLKCNHGCGYNLIVKNKEELNLEEAKRKINSWLTEDFAFYGGFELHYSPIPRKIIAEQYIENKDSGDLVDYKFWCFNGKMKYVALISGRENQGGATMAFYDSDWNKQNFTTSYPLSTTTAVRPDNLEEMIAVAEKLAADFNHVRVDLYRMDDGRIYFGEMTFTTASGNCKWNPAEMNSIMGSYITLPIKDSTQASNH